MGTKCSFLIFLFILPLTLAELKIGFYQSSCPRAESIVRGVVQKRFQTDKSIPAALLRMHFHDCFVRGCDASILIESTNQKQSERDAGPNLTVRGFELIDEVKESLEKECPSTVSCADIITLATRDAVALAKGPNYSVPTGRRDGLVSNADEVNLPGPSSTVREAFQAFKAKGLTLNDMVTLLGGHTVGVAHCSFFQDRLSNFQGTNAPDRRMDPALIAKLNRICGTTANNNDPTAFLDQGTSFVFDNQFYNQTIFGRGILQIDQELASDTSTSRFVSGFASNPSAFSESFAKAMTKMGSIQVLVGTAGEIRQKCNVVNQAVKPQKPISQGKGKPKKPINKGHEKPKKGTNQGKKQKPKTKKQVNKKQKPEAKKQKPTNGKKKHNPRAF